MKKATTLLAVTCITAFLAAAYIIFLADTDPAQLAARACINALIPGSISWEELSLSPSTGRVRIRSAALAAPDGSVIASFKKLEARVSVPALLGGRLIIREAELLEPAIDFSLDDTGSFNLLAALGIKPGKSEKKGSLPRFLSVQRLVLANGRARWSQPSAGIAAGLESIDISAALDFGDLAGDIALETGGGFFSHRGRVTGVTCVSASGAMKNGSMAPVLAEVRTGGSRIAVRGGVAELFTAPRFDVTAGFALSLAELRDMLALNGTMDGVLAGDLSLAGPLASPSAALRCAYGGGQLQGIRIDSARLDARLEDREVGLHALTVRAAGGSATVSGSVRLRDAFPDGFLSGNRDMDGTAYDLSAVLARFPLGAVPGGRLGGSVSARASARGAGFSAEAAAAVIRVEATAEGFSFGEGSRPAPLTLAVTGGLDRGLVKADSLVAALGGFRASGSGSLDRVAGSVFASVSGSSADLSREAAAFGVNAGGSCTIDAAVSGPLRTPSLSLRLRGDSLRYGGIALGSASGEASLEQDGTARLSGFSLANGSSRVSLSGATRLDLAGAMGRNMDRPLSLDIRAFDVRLEDFSEELAGRVTLDGGLRGSLMHPAGTVRLTASALDLGFQKLDTVSLVADARGGRIYLDPLTIDVAPGETARIGGWITPSGAYRLTASAEGISLAGNAYARTAGLDGTLDIDLEGAGTIADPAAEGSVALKSVRYRDRQLEDFRIHVSLANRVLRAKGRLNFDLAGHYDIVKKNFSVSLLFDRTDISPLLAAAAGPGMSATLSGSLSARGTLGRVQGLELSADLSDCGVSSGGRQLLHADSLRATLNGGVLTLPRTRIALLESGWLRFSGSGPIMSAVSIDADGLIPVELAGLLGSSIANASGSVSFTGGIRGNLFSPAITAGVTLGGIGFDVPALGNGLRGVSGSVDIRPGLVSIPGIRGSLGNGTVGISGSIGMKGLSPRDITLGVRADRAGISVPDTLDIDFNARLSVAGTPERVMVRGDVTVLKGLYYRDLVLHPFRNIGARRDRKEEPAGAQQALDRIRFDVALLNRNPFEIDNNIARMTINNNLRVTGSAARPVLNGSLRVESGRLFYLGREFVINTGKVDFLNPYRIDPAIDIRGSASIQGWNVQIGLAGKLDELAFTLSSQPVLDSADILSLVLLGTTRGKKSSLPAGQLISEAIALTYGAAIKKKTGIDSIEIRSGDEGTRASSRAFSATIGKNLNDRVTYYYTVGRDERGLKSSTTLEYRFFDNILVDTEYDSGGRAGASIRYSRSFR